VSSGRRPTAPVAAYLALVMGAGPLVHYALTALGPVVVDSLGLTATEFGLLWFVVFGAASLTTILGGRLADHLQVRSMLVTIFGLATISLVMVATAPGYAVLLVALALSGVAQAVANPATNRVVIEQVDSRRQGLVMGLKQSGVQGSQFLAGLALPTVAVLLGWRGAFATCCALSVLGLSLTLLLGRGAPRPVPGTGPVAGGVDTTVAWLTGYAFLAGAAMQATNVHLPLYAHDVLDLSATSAGMITAVLGGVGVLARFVWGHTSSRSDDFRDPLTQVALIALVALAAIWASAEVGPWLLWVGAALFSFSALAANVIVMIVVVRTTPHGQVGRASGRVSLGLFLGFMVGPSSAGALIDHLGYPAAWAALLGLTAVSVAVPLVWRHRTPRLPGAR
jgi:MFS family permease